MEETRLDQAFYQMAMAPHDDAARLAWYETFADTELFLMLEQEPEAANITPALFDLTDGRFALVFDLEDRLAAFAGEVVPYAALPGRVIVAALAGQGVGICVNLEAAPSAFVMPAEAVDWLHGALNQSPEEATGQLAPWVEPQDLALGVAFFRKFDGKPLPAASVWFAGLRRDKDTAVHAFVFVDVVAGFEEALAKATSETVMFAGHDPAGVEILFLTADQAKGIEGPGKCLWVPPATPGPIPAPEPAAPGTDPSRPPRLR